MAVGVPLNTLLRAQGSVRALGHAEGSPGWRRQFCSEITGVRHRARVTVTGGLVEDLSEGDLMVPWVLPLVGAPRSPSTSPTPFLSSPLTLLILYGCIQNIRGNWTHSSLSQLPVPTPLFKWLPCGFNRNRNCGGKCSSGWIRCWAVGPRGPPACFLAHWLVNHW